jgi:hypothetical protein
VLGAIERADLMNLVENPRPVPSCRAWRSNCPDSGDCGSSPSRMICYRTNLPRLVLG